MTERLCDHVSSEMARTGGTSIEQMIFGTPDPTYVTELSSRFSGLVTSGVPDPGMRAFNDPAELRVSASSLPGSSV